MAHPTKDTEQITFRLPRAWLDDLGVCATILGEEEGSLAVVVAMNGLTRTDALRVCLRRGMDSVIAGAMAGQKARRKRALATSTRR